MSAAEAGDLLYLPWTGAPPPADIGGKARGLMDIEAAGLPMPPWFVVRPAAQLLGENRKDEIAGAIHEVCGALGGPFAVRSSALDEDGAELSFAGQHLTVLNAPDAGAVMAALPRCWSSASSPSARAYRSAHGLGESAEMAVIVQSLVLAEASGVAFARSSPPDKEDVDIAAARGLGAPLMSGEIDGDEYHVRGDQCIAERRQGRQEWREDSGPDGGLERSEVSLEQQHRPVLSDEQIVEVALTARRLVAHLGAPQDVEWAYSDGQLFIVQTRPITGSRPPRLDGEVRVWDNSNIVESFPGLTLPLTFSVAREAYAAIYPGVCRAAGVSPQGIENNAGVFEQLLGLIQGRVYYNLNSWYAVLALLPGFAHSQAWMERMMGARRPASAAGSATSPPSGGRRSAGPASQITADATPRRHRPNATAAVALLIWRLATLEREARRFRRSMEALRSDFGARDLDALSVDALLDHSEQVRQRAVTAWRAPILNDLFLMVFHGALRQLAGRWLGVSGDAAVNAALRTGTMPSTAPARVLEGIAASVRDNPDWLGVTEGSDSELLARLRSDDALGDLRREIDSYLGRWGDRSPEELQLDRPSYRDDPLPLLHTIRDLASRPATSADAAERSRARRGVGNRRGFKAGDGIAGFVRRSILAFLLRRTQYHLALREEMRLTRTEVFGMARRTFAAMGRGLCRLGLLDTPEDIHYLDVAELRSLIRGTGAVGDPRGLVHLRKDLYAGYREAPAPLGRIETRGPVVKAFSLGAPAPCLPGTDGGVPNVSTTRLLLGTGTSPGCSRAPAVVVLDPHRAEAVDGRIVVARSTDPGWLSLLLPAAGLVVEHGSTLSHSAIVARELGLPMVVGVAGATSSIPTGCSLRMDGGTGEVWVEAAGAPAA